MTVNEQRQQLELLLEDSASLRAKLAEFLSRAYRNAVQSALEETGFLKSPFPVACPYTPEQVLNCICFENWIFVGWISAA